MKLFYTREVDADQVTIRYTSTWIYLLLAGIALMLILSFIKLPFNHEPIKQAIFWTYAVVFVIYYLATRKMRYEMLQAIRERRIKVRGSRFNPNNPLVVVIDKKKKKRT